MAKKQDAATARMAKVEQANVSALFDERSAAIDQAVKDLRAGRINQDAFLDSLDKFSSSQSLSPVAQERLKLRADQALARAVEPRPAGPDIPLPQFANVMEGQRMANIQKAVPTAVQRIVGGANPAQIPQLQPLMARMAQARTMPELKDQVARLVAAAGPIGELNAAKQSAARMVASANPPMDLFGGHAVAKAQADIAAARSASEAMAAGQAGEAAAGRGRGMKLGIGAGISGVLMTMLASKMFGKKDEMDPQVQMALAQQLAGRGGGEQDEGRTDTRTLMNMGRLLSLIKGVQSMGGMQGAGPRPQLI